MPRRVLFIAAVLLLVIGTTFGQQTAGTSSEIRHGSTLPATCTPNIGQIFAVNGSTLYVCTTTNVWKNVGALSFGKTFFADSYSGSTVDVKVNACIADVIAAGGGTCDATALSGTQTIAAEIDVGNSSAVPVTLRLPYGATWQTTITDGTSCALKVFDEASVLGGGVSGFPMSIKATASAHLDALVCTDPAPPLGGSYVRIDGIQAYSPSGALLAHGAFNIQKLYDHSLISNIDVANYNGVGLYIHSVCCDTRVVNATVNGNSSSGAQPLLIGATGEGTSDLSIDGLSCGQPGAGLQCVVAQGGDWTHHIRLNNVYLENSTADSTTSLIKLNIGGPFSAYGVHQYGLGAGTSGYLFEIPSGVHSVDLRNISADSLNLVNDTANSKTLVATSTLTPGNYQFGTVQGGYYKSTSTWSLPTLNNPFSTQAGSAGHWDFGQNVGAGSGDDTFGFYSGTWGGGHSSLPVLQLNSSDGSTNGVIINASTGFKANGTSGMTVTKTVKGSDGNNCNLVYTMGLLTSTTCP